MAPKIYELVMVEGLRTTSGLRAVNEIVCSSNRERFKAAVGFGEAVPAQDR